MDKKLTIIFKNALAILVSACFFTLLMALMFYDVKENQTLNIMFGAFATAFITIMNYYFGSSQGSKDKSEAMNTQNKPQENTAK